jgi:hypothetical protein
MARPDPPPPLPNRNWQYRCEACGTRVVVATADVLRHIDTGWPTCCGRVMLLTPLPLPDEPPRP